MSYTNIVKIMTSLIGPGSMPSLSSAMLRCASEKECTYSHVIRMGNQAEL